MPLDAYIILDGGGVKGAALAGCLHALEIAKVRPKGFGGCSAGAIVAALGASGFTGNEIASKMRELALNNLLDDDQPSIDSLKEFVADAHKSLRSRLNPIPPAIRLKKHKALLQRLETGFGLHSGDKIQNHVIDLILEKHPSLKDNRSFSFTDLSKCEGTYPLKIIATDITRRKAMIFATDGSNKDQPVADAVRASMSYPFAFTPVIMGKRKLVDGGLSSSLPVFLYREEHLETGNPILAFDLVTSPPPACSLDNYSTEQFIHDMLVTALESSDKVIRDYSKGVFRIPINLDDCRVDTLDFAISREKRDALINKGFAATIESLTNRILSGDQDNELDVLHDRFGPPELFEPVMKAVCKHIEGATSAVGTRSQVMLPRGDGTKRLVVYSYGMDGHTDQHSELSTGAGCTGRAFTDKTACVANLEKTKQNPEMWGMTEQEQSRVHKDQRSIIAVPIFADSFGLNDLSGEHVIGTLSVDSSTDLPDTGWIKATAASESDEYLVPEVINPMSQWSEILSRMLSSRG